MLPAASGQGTSRSVAGRVNPALGAVTEGLLELLWDHQGGRVPEDALAGRKRIVGPPGMSSACLTLISPDPMAPCRA